jgi:hypothetical protein
MVGSVLKNQDHKIRILYSASQAHQKPAETHAHFELSKLHRQVSSAFEYQEPLISEYQEQQHFLRYQELSGRKLPV